MMNVKSRRILIVDDNHSIHEDLMAILSPRVSRAKDPETKALESELFDRELPVKSPEPELHVTYKIDHAYQGQESIEKVELAEEEGDPYSLIFMDVRMPPGMDGIQAAHRIWQKYPRIEMVICTVYSDYSWKNIINKLGTTDRLFFLKKPFESVTINQLALSLTNKWSIDRINDEHIKTLEKEVENRTLQLENIVSQLQSLKNDTRTKIVSKPGRWSDMSGVITTPLSGIMGMTDLLLDTDLDKEQRDFARIIKSSGTSLYALVHEALDSSGMDEEPIQISHIRFNLRTTIENITDHYILLAREQNLSLIPMIHADVPETLVGDPARLRQILAEILEFALKYAQTRELVLTVSREPTRSGQKASGGKKKLAGLRFSLAGIKARMPGHTMDDSNGREKGYDMAVHSDRELAVSKKLVGLMGGHFEIESRSGDGSGIWFNLELEVVGTPDYRIESASNSARGMRILAVSDNLTNGKVIELYIHHWGGSCAVAHDKDMAVEKLRHALKTEPFDLVILDLKNSNTQKYIEYARKIRCRANLQSIPIICLTSQARRGDARIFKDHGFSAYLTKPIRQSHLFNCLLLLKDQYKNNSILKQMGLITKHLVDEFASDKYYLMIVGGISKVQRKLIKRLNRLNIRCDVAAGFETALKSYKVNNYDMILMDCHSNIQKGCETVTKIRKHVHGKSNHIPILALIRDMGPEERKNCLEAGMEDFLTSPYTFEKIEEILKKFVLGKV